LGDGYVGWNSSEMFFNKRSGSDFPVKWPQFEARILNLAIDVIIRKCGLVFYVA
jgi:hypothetical protein